MVIHGLRVWYPAVQPAKVQNIHRSFPHFLHIAYGWLTIASLRGVWLHSKTAQVDYGERAVTLLQLGLSR